MGTGRIAVIVGAIASVLLQAAVAPYIGIGHALPDFIAVFTLLVAVSRPNSFGAAMPFLLGLAYDLLVGGPVGAMAFSLTAFSCLSARLFAALDNDTAFMPVALMGLGLFLVEASYGSFLLAFGYHAGLLEALAYRVAPCFAYDFVVGAVLFLAIGRFFKRADSPGADIMLLR